MHIEGGICNNLIIGSEDLVIEDGVVLEGTVRLSYHEHEPVIGNNITVKSKVVLQKI